MLPYLDKADPWSSHSQIKRRLTRLRAGIKILDVGTATGTLGRLCSGAGFELYGLEPNEEWAALARPHYTAMAMSSLEEATDAFLSGHDAVVCADVIEHLARPEDALRRLLSLQPEGCIFIISVPNVANVWVRLHLLFGRFDYTDRGILDQTHLRFFTRRTFLALLEAVGLQVTDIDVTPIPLNLVHPWFRQAAAGRFLHMCLARLTKRRPTLLGYQFIVQAIKPILRDDHVRSQLQSDHRAARL
jgi:2-polyprenyl-3-methyl-5-hydroxy-6-metoxy-1,4-benzoquinol methylase